MKKTFTLFLALTLLLCGCQQATTPEEVGESTDDAGQTTEKVTETETETEAPLTYILTSPYNDLAEPVDTFDDLEDAKTKADKQVRFGYVVYDSKGEIAYIPTPTLTAARILYEAKEICDYIRDNGYSYGHAAINPAIAKGEPDCDKLVSCDRLVGWALYDAGFVKKQPQKHGLMADLIPFLEKYGFTKITDVDEILPGDIIYVGSPGQAEPYGHVFINAGQRGKDGNYYRYDGGSNTRIRSTQPSLEPISQPPNRVFICAYRAPERDLVNED